MKHGSALQKTALGLGLLLLAAMVAACTGTPVITSSSVAPASTLLPAPQDSSNTLFGFIDTSGRWVVKPQFQGASGFSEGLAAVKLGGKWGYVDDNGTVVIPPQFTEAHLFENGIARVATGPSPGPDDSPGLRTASGYGFIEKTGKIVIPATWDDAGDFSAGLAPVMKGSVCGFINTKGTLVIPLQFDATLRFSEGLAPASKDGKWGYIDTHGRWTIKPQYPGIGGNEVIDDSIGITPGQFQDGLAPVPSEGHIGTAAWYYIDKTGKKAFAQEFRHAGQFNEGLAPVETDAGWGFINTSGTTVIKPQFKATEYFDFTKYLSEYQGFHDGLAAVVDAGGKVGYIDQTGKFVVQPQFVIGNGFAGGFAYAYPPSPTAFTEPAPENPHWYGPLSIIDVTGRTIYQAPTAP